MIGFVNVMFSTAQDDTVLMFPMFLQIILDLYQILYSCVRSEVTEVQIHEVNLLFECILIRDCQAALPSWFPR